MTHGHQQELPGMIRKLRLYCLFAAVVALIGLAPAISVPTADDEARSAANELAAADMLRRRHSDLM